MTIEQTARRAREREAPRNPIMASPGTDGDALYGRRTETPAREPANDIQTIELDCAPGPVRPWHLIQYVCQGTDLAVTGDPVPAFFGLAVWSFDMPREEWVERIQPIIKPRIEALYSDGMIRFGSWG